VKNLLKGRSSAAMAAARLRETVTQDRMQAIGPDGLERLQEKVMAAIRSECRPSHITIRQGISRSLQVIEMDLDFRAGQRRR